MVSTLKSKYIKLYFYLIAGFLWANFSSVILRAQTPDVLEARLERCNNLYAKYSSPEFLERSDSLCEKYSAPEFIDKIINKEKKRIEAQEQFNNKVLFGLNLPIHDNGVQISVCNRDWMLLLVVSSQWVADFIFFKMLCGALQTSLQNLCLQQSKEILEVLAKLNKSIELKHDEEIKKTALELDNIVNKVVHAGRIKYFQAIAAFAASTNIIYRAQSYYRLNSLLKQNLIDFAFANIVYSTKQAPIDNSLMEFLKDKTVAGFDFGLVQTTLLDVTTSILCENGILPEWVMGNKFDLARRITFASIFTWWANKNIYKPILFSYLVSSRKSLMPVLEKLSYGDLDQQKTSAKELETILQTMPQCSFALWESNKRKNFAQWHTISNIVILMPALFKLGACIYNMSKNVNNMNKGTN